MAQDLETTISETTVMYAVLAFMWIDSTWTNYLSFRQERTCRTSHDVPEELKGFMSKESFDKSRCYSLDRIHYGFIRDIASLLTSTAIIYYHLFANLWTYAESCSPLKGEIFVSCVWIVLLMVIDNIIQIPFQVYITFVLEKKYKFNKQTAQFFIMDKFKIFFLQVGLTLPLSIVAIIIIKHGGEYFFVWLWLLAGLLYLALFTIYGAYIAPIFDRHTPLPEGKLRTDIESLARDVDFPLQGLYVVEGLYRSTHSNAYYTGMFNCKMIVLYDTLLDGSYTNDEILGVLSHELGHWKNNHVIKKLIMAQTDCLLMFLFFSFMFNFPPVYQAFGFPPGVQPVLIGLIIVGEYIMVPYNAVRDFIFTCLSRSFEFEADSFAVSLGKVDALERSLIKLYVRNLSFPLSDWLYSMWYHSHPQLLERLDALKKIK